MGWNPDLSYTWRLYKETVQTDAFIFGLSHMSKMSEMGKDEPISVQGEKLLLHLEPIWRFGKAEVLS